MVVAFNILVFVVEAVIFVAKRLVKNPVMPLMKLEKKLVEEAFTKFALVAFKVLIVALVIVALPNIGLFVNM